MIDLSTDDGIRQAMREVSQWQPPAPAARHRQSGGIQLTRRAATIALFVIALGATLAIRQTMQQPAAGVAGRWESMAQSSLSPRFGPTTLWTGSELLVWGGFDPNGQALVDGASYNPETDDWALIADYPFPLPESSYSDPNTTVAFATGYKSVWHDDEAIFVVPSSEGEWGWDLIGYGPETQQWRTLERSRFDQLPTDALERTGGSASIDTISGLFPWQDGVLIVGGRSDRNESGFTTFKPETGIWGPFTAFPDQRDPATTPIGGTPLLIDGELVVLHGGPVRAIVGFSFNFETEETRPIQSPQGVPADRGWFDGNITADGLLIGTSVSDDGQSQRVAYRLNLSTGTWRTVAAPPKGPADEDSKDMAIPVATPTGYLLLGGLKRDGTFGGLTSETANLSADIDVERWRGMADPPIDLNRTGHAMVWTGSEVIIWGGATTEDGGPVNLGTRPLNDGARFVLD